MGKKVWKKLIEYGFEYKCLICGYTRFIEICHIIPKQLGGDDDSNNLIPLCPNHHKLLDYALLNREELPFIEKKVLDLTYDQDVQQNLKQLDWLYFILRIKGSPPPWLRHRRLKLYKRISNKY
jgi:predicted restriction endonuclease